MIVGSRRELGEVKPVGIRAKSGQGAMDLGAHFHLLSSIWWSGANSFLCPKH